MCTQLFNNTRRSATWRIAVQTRTFFLQTCEGSHDDGAFWKRNEKRLLLHPIIALKLWTANARCWIRLRQLKKPVIEASESCPRWSTLVRWAWRRRWPGVPSKSKLKLHVNAILVRVQDGFWEALCWKHWVWRQHLTVLLKRPKFLRMTCTSTFLSFFFFFYFFRLFLEKKRTHKQMRPRNVVVLICQTFISTASWHWPGRARSAFFQITSPGSTPYTSDVKWYKPDNNLGRSGEIMT